jgi:hypothetical protein
LDEQSSHRKPTQIANMPIPPFQSSESFIFATHHPY